MATTMRFEDWKKIVGGFRRGDRFFIEHEMDDGTLFIQQVEVEVFGFPGIIRIQCLEAVLRTGAGSWGISDDSDLHVAGIVRVAHRREDLLSTTRVFDKDVVIKVEEMDKVVLATEAKEEILAVLKQHTNAQKIFEEWGLGEVIEYGKGMTFLFYGSPGTGKTWAAHCMAKALGRELLVVSASEVQSSEPGGANRAIEAAFGKAKKEKKILFLDECDSLVTSREGMGMIMSSEVNTLLTSIEKFEGVLILATNRADMLDAALERRISLIVEFPNPNHPQRVEIWKKLLPKKLPLGKGVNAESLADYALSGGQIKNVVLQAARLAVAADSKKVELSHFEVAINRLNKSKSLLGSASRYNQRISLDVGKGKKVIDRSTMDITRDVVKKDIEKVEGTDKVEEITPTPGKK